MSPIHYPAELPITARREEIVATIARHQVLVLAGETGSGKTTQLPKMCLEALPEARGRIGCTQPRRVAAMSVSRRVAQELRVPWGREVGCKVRFQDDTRRETRVKFMTDGILLAEIQSDPLLRGYSAIIVDEAHERSLNIDFLLGYLHRLLPRRPDLKVLITSATIDTLAFSEHFGKAPVIEVSGRLYPVEIRYAPPSGDEEASFVDNAVAAVEDLLIETADGDALVFMPTERDIRETCDLLEGRLGKGMEVLGLYGRQSAADQQRVFDPGPKRRVIVATNVAETSVTLPRIRCVVDTGLARMSRYNPRTRTKRLPVEAISQSSANQRAGRAGRLRDGVCVRLYTEEDFGKRAPFTTPEIQRANLAEVILRMKAFRLGEIEDFPFLHPPSSASIRAGYQLLHELGALNETHEMTPLGGEMARLPVDPTLARMLLQAQREDCLPEMLVIAAGLSIPDPRERPEDAKEAAAAAHRAWHCPDSDFLSLLRLWRAAPDPESQASRNALRRFCKTNYLSLVRMREWRDLWRQLRETFRGEGPARPAESPAERSPRDNALHRCILAAQLGHVAQREDRNVYRAGGNRQVMIHPGSNLHLRKAPPTKKKAAPAAAHEKKPKQPDWIVAGEIVLTSQLFARMVARVDPVWIVELGAHLCQARHSEPRWDARGGRVICWERVTLHGLEVQRSAVDYGKVDPVGATRLFIQHALVEDDAGIALRFHRENRQLVERIRTLLSRVRSRLGLSLDDRLQAFYEARLENVSSVHDLNRAVKAKLASDPGWLCATEADLTGDGDVDCDLSQFPDEVSLGNTVLPLTYAYSPGGEEDGVTVRIPLPLVEHLSPAQVQWMVPGLRESQIDELLRSLPKALRKQLQPIEPKAREVARDFDPGRADFLEALARHVSRRYDVPVRKEDWISAELPAHLRPRVEVTDEKRRETMAAGRDLEALRTQLQPKAAAVKSDAWEMAARRWERHGLTSWSFGDLPVSVEIEEVAGKKVLGFPGLERTPEGVSVKLYRRQSEAERHSPGAVRHLAELVAARDIAWLRKELRSLAPLSLPSGQVPPAPAPAGDFRSTLAQIGSQLASPRPAVAHPADTRPFPEQAVEHILRHALRLDPLFPLTSARFEALCGQARKDLPGLAHRLRGLLKEIEGARREILARPHRHPGLEEDLRRLVPPDLPATTPHAQLIHVPRYLRAVRVRAERAALHPGKDAEKARLIAAVEGWELPGEKRETYRWMLEEYRVSVFAPELGTAQPVSVKRLENLREPGGG